MRVKLLVASPPEDEAEQQNSNDSQWYANANACLGAYR
jgi:hypothetical protein